MSFYFHSKKFKAGLLARTSSAFVCSGKSLSFLHFWRIVLSGIESLVDIFFQYFEYFISFYLTLKHFCCEIHWSSYGFPFACSLLFLAALRIPSLYLLFDNLIIMWLCKMLFRFNLLGVEHTLLSFLFFWNSYYVNVVCFHCIPKVL